jgi:hypothetical protein
MLRWHKSIQRKIVFGGLIFKIGIVSIGIAIIGKGILAVPYFTILGVAGFILLVVGILCTRTHPEKVKVELANNA